MLIGKSKTSVPDEFGRKVGVYKGRFFLGPRHECQKGLFVHYVQLKRILIRWV